MRYTGFPPKVRKVIGERSGGICEVQANIDNIELVWELDDRWRERLGKFCGCRGAGAVQQHHRRNRGSGGTRRDDTNLPSNALHACLNCHELIGRYPSLAYDAGWLVRQAHDPADVPVVRRGRLVWLDDLGGIEQAA